MASLAKVTALAHDLADELKNSQSLVVSETFGTTGLPLIRVGSAAAGSAGALIRIIPQDWPEAKDILGLTANIYHPSVIQVLTELNPAGGAGADINTALQTLQILAPLVRRGTRVDVYTRANGGQPVEGDITSGNLKGGVDGHYIYGMVAGAQ